MAMAPKKRRFMVAALLAAYLAFAVWAFYFSHSAEIALYMFLPLSALIWIVMRAFRGKA